MGLMIFKQSNNKAKKEKGGDEKKMNGKGMFEFEFEAKKIGGEK